MNQNDKATVLPQGLTAEIKFFCANEFGDEEAASALIAVVSKYWRSKQQPRQPKDVPTNNRDGAMTPPILGGDNGAETSSIPAQRTSLPAEVGTSGETVQPQDDALVEQIADIIMSNEPRRTSDVYEASSVSYERGLACLKAQRIYALLRPTVQAFDDAKLLEAANAEWQFVTNSQMQTNADRIEGMKKALRFLGVLK